MIFADHHNYKSRDIDAIEQRLEQLGDSSIILTTEKDAVKLALLNKQNIYALKLKTVIDVEELLK